MQLWVGVVSGCRSNLLKNMVGAWGLDPQTSTVSIMRCNRKRSFGLVPQTGAHYREQPSSHHDHADIAQPMYRVLIGSPFTSRTADQFLAIRLTSLNNLGRHSVAGASNSVGPQLRRGNLRIPTASGISKKATRSGNSKPDSDLGRVCTLAEAEREHISEVVEMISGLIAGKCGAAEALGVPPSTLRNRMKKLGIKP